MRISISAEQSERERADHHARRLTADYPSLQLFLEAFVAERLGDPGPMKAYLEACRVARDRRRGAP